ncbi:MAG TPA: hypothetical protein VMT74_08420 [Gaiellaceae bacterium]|nr:hypothetical protein [Gaiellaceae bacterium]
MRVVVSDAAADRIREHGGRLYVSVRSAACCRAVPRLATAFEPQPRVRFRRVPESGDVELYVPEDLAPLPDELELDVSRFSRRRVDAYWNGCAWIV